MSISETVKSTKSTFSIVRVILALNLIFFTICLLLLICWQIGHMFSIGAGSFIDYLYLLILIPYVLYFFIISAVLNIILLTYFLIKQKLRSTSKLASIVVIIISILTIIHVTITYLLR
jgi:hypothetical protein